MNYMEQVAQMLGVEMGEEFYIDGMNGYLKGTKFQIDDEGLYRVDKDKDRVLALPYIIMYLLSGKFVIRKITKRKHTGLEDMVEKDEPIYALFGFRKGIPANATENIPPEFFTNKETRDNWERYITTKKRLAKAASELSDGPIDWSNESQLKWYINCDCEDVALGSELAKVYVNDSIYFTSKEAVEKAIEIVGKDDLIWMLRDFQPFIGYSEV